MSKKDVILTIRWMAGILSFFYILALGIDYGRSYLEDKAAWGNGPIRIYHGQFNEASDDSKYDQAKPTPKPKQRTIELI